jgi:hypothetical protein
MKQIKVYHNPHFLDYQGSHGQIIPPTQPVASVRAAAEMPLVERLGLAFRQTQHTGTAWFNNPDVMTHLRSTSVGDLIDDGDGNLYVVESFGFQPYRPPAAAPVHKIATACRELDEASAGGSRHVLTTAARTAVAAMQQWLSAEGYPESESPIMWENAQPGDLIGTADGWQYRVIARKLRPKWRARRLGVAIPGAQVWIDSPRTWAVVLPLGQRGNK